MTEPQRYFVTRDQAGYLQLEWRIEGKVRAALPLEDEEALALSQALLLALEQKGQ